VAKSDSFRTSGWRSSSGDVASLLFSWTAKQSVEANTSTISWTLQGHKTEDVGFVKAGGFTVVIDGETVYSKSTDYRIELRNGTVIASGTKTITHKPDGSRTFTVYVEGGIYYFAVNCSGTHTFTLDTIPRASSIACTPAEIESNPTITISRASSNFTHTVTYQFGSLTGTIVENTSATSITNWTIPPEFYDEIPREKGQIGILYCTTYSGGNKIGETTKCDLVVNTNEAKCKPDVFGTVRDVDERMVALTGDENTLIRGWSLAECVMTATPKNGAKIKKMLVNSIQSSGTIRYVGVDTGSFNFYAEDERGYFNNYLVTKTLIPYVDLTAHVKAQRTDPTSGKATLEIEGNYYAGSFGAADNTLTVLYKQWDGTWEGDDTGYIQVEPTIDEQNNKYSCTVALEGLEYDKSFPFEVVVKDKLCVLSRKVTLGKGIPVFDWGEDDFNFNVPVTINGVNLLEKLAELEALIKAKG
jgi:hypothetical protein